MLSRIYHNQPVFSLTKIVIFEKWGKAMRQTSNRQCYNSYYVPFETMAHASWSPTYVRCDCGELARNIVHCRRLSYGTLYFQKTFIWRCSHCRAQYRQIKGTFDFERINEREEDPDGKRRPTV